MLTVKWGEDVVTKVTVDKWRESHTRNADRSKQTFATIHETPCAAEFAVVDTSDFQSLSNCRLDAALLSIAANI